MWCTVQWKIIIFHHKILWPTHARVRVGHKRNKIYICYSFLFCDHAIHTNLWYRKQTYNFCNIQDYLLFSSAMFICLFKINVVNAYGCQWSCQYLGCMKSIYHITNILSNKAVDSQITRLPTTVNMVNVIPLVGNRTVEIVTDHRTGVVLCMRQTNERRRYIVTSFLIGWAHT